MVETITLADDRLMVIDEEGKLKQGPHRRNEQATKLLLAAGGAPDDYIVGTALICSQDEIQ